jgi:PST family polysaccharide transporter
MDETPNWNLLHQLSRKAANRLQSLRGTGVRRLAENVLSLAMLQAAAYLMPLITLPYLVRVLGADKFGLVAFAQAVTQYFIILSDFGFNLSAPRDIASHRDDLEKVSRIFSSVMIIRLALMTVEFGLLFLLVNVVGRLAQDPLIFLLSYGLVLGNVLFPVWFYQGMEKMKYSTALALVARSIFVVLIFVFIKEQADYYLVPVLNSLGIIVAGIMSLGMAVKKFRVSFLWPGVPMLRSQIRDSAQFFLSRVSVSVYSSLNTIVLGFAATNKVVGYYAAAEKLFIAMRSAFYPLVQSLYPYMSSRENVKLFKKVFSVSVLGALVLGAAVFVFSDTITRIIFGSAFAPSASLVRMFSVLIPVVAASVLLGYPFLAALRHEKYANFSVAIGSVVHLILIVLILPIMTPHLVVAATMATETIILSIRIYGIRKHKLWRTV